MNTSVKLSVILLLLLCFLYLPNHVLSAEVKYFEDFNDGTADGWNVTLLDHCLNSNWTVKDGMYGFKVDSNDRVNGCKTHTILTSHQIPIDADYIYEFDMKFSESSDMDRNFLIKYSSPNEWYGIHIVNTFMLLEKVYSGSSPFPEKYYDFISDYTHHFWVHVSGKNIRLVIDYDKFDYTYTDTDPVLPNSFVGLRASTGYILSSEVWFDNISLTIYPKTNYFNLPIQYDNRPDPTQLEFKTMFWNRLTASFDHSKLGNKFIPFTTNEYIKKDCGINDLGIKCYDSHNGTDFRPTQKGAPDEVLPVADGKIVYASSKDKNGKCIADKSGYGCTVVMYHPQQDLYSLYAHLSKIEKQVSDTLVRFTEVIGNMGNTGCGPKCGVHLHLGVLKDKTPDNLKRELSATDWESLFAKAQPKTTTDNDAPPKHYCTYVVANGNILSFQDPSGWAETSKQDPWAQTKELGSCGTESPYMWLRNIGISKTSENIEHLWYNENLD